MTTNIPSLLASVPVYIREHAMFPFAALALVLATAMAGCTDTAFVGDEAVLAQGDSTAICFGTASEPTTRGGSRNLEAFEGTMRVYAAKLNSTYATAINHYAVWNTSSDPDKAGDWEYVGTTGDTKTVVKGSKAGTTNNFTVPQRQVMKFWDYSCTQYLFWALAPYSDQLTFNVASDKTVASATLTGIDGHLTANNTTTPNTYTPYYLANPVRVQEANFGSTNGNNPVSFDFEEVHAKVRVAFYETIPSYKVVSIKFYNQSTLAVDEHIVFNRAVDAFTGTKKSDNVTPTATVTYNNTSLTRSIAYSGLKTQTWIQFGKLALSASQPMTDASVANNPSWGTDGDMESGYYFTVLPTPETYLNKQYPITLKADITLKAEDASEEEITLVGVEGIVPIEYSTWLPNHAYSYVFKLTAASINLKKIEFDAEASSITKNTSTHNYDLQ